MARKIQQIKINKIQMKKYKITKRGSFYYIYERFLLFLWMYKTNERTLEDAKKTINKYETQEVIIEYV
jgi:hypothetical protein